MAKDYQQLWEDATATTGEAHTVWALAGILADKDGRLFISSLDSKDAVSCIEILDNVSRYLHLPLSPLPQAVSPGYCRAKHQTCREAGILSHVEETY